MSFSRLACPVALLLASTLLAIAPGHSGEKQNSATTPIIRDVARHKKFLALAEKGDVDVVFLGDNLIQGWNNNKTWKMVYEPLKAANFGLNGDQTGHVLWRITEGHELDKIRPKVAILQIGTNNTTARDNATPEQIAEGIALIVKTIHDKLPATKILLLGVFPRGAQGATSIRQKIAAINKSIAKLDDGGKTVKYLDIGDKFLQKSGSISKDIMPDGLHLSPKGYEIWAEAMNPTLKELLK